MSFWPTVSVIAGGTAIPPTCRSGCTPLGWSHSSSIQTPPVPHWSMEMVLTPDSCSLPPHTWSQVHLSCTFSGLVSGVDRAPFANNEGLMTQGKSLAPLDMGEGNGWILALGLCGTCGSLSRGPALKVAVVLAPCPPVSCRQYILPPLCLQPLPHLAPAGKTGKAQGWVGGAYMGVNQGKKAKLDFFQTLIYPFLSCPCSLFGLPWRFHGQGEVLAGGCPMASSLFWAPPLALTPVESPFTSCSLN